MEVTLTIENSAGEQGTVSAAGADYESAYKAARELIPEGWTAIAIRAND